MKLLQLGSVPYAEAWDLQRQIFDSVVTGEEEDTLILLEHPHVYTQGRVTVKENLLFTPEQLSAVGAETFEIDRGGDVTYHGPGQLVGYPILNLSHFKEDLGWYLRAIEESIIHLLATYDISGFRIAGRTGVWVGSTGNEEKICAIGIRASRWCTMHGFALNVSTDLSYFNLIVPCGIGDRTVTSIERMLGRPVRMEEVQERYARSFEEVFEVELHSFIPHSSPLIPSP
jgi:lipoyl(octanoyl) transferase